MESTSTFFVCLLFAAALFGRVNCVCVESIREDTKVDSIVIENITQYCGGALVTEKDDNPYFNINGSDLVLTQSVKLESNDSSVGNGTCNGHRKLQTPQSPTFNCGNNGVVSCDITIDQQDDYPPSFCNKSCYSTDRISVHLSETHQLERSALFYTGRVCDRDACTADSCFTDNLLVNNSDLIGFNTQPATATFNLWIKQTLDFEKSQVHYVGLTLNSSAHGYINTTLIINVGDEDDHSPAFTKRIYKCTTSEGTIAGPISPQCKVEGYDQDFGINATLQYEITASFPDDNNFTIGQDGILAVNGELDRETVSEYVLEIMVYQDGRKQDRYNFTTVIIDVADIDDNPPTFANKSVSIEIVENLNNGVVIFTPTVTDKDEDENANFTFTMKGDESSLFKIDAVTGAISVNDSKHLDRETLTQPIKLTICVNSTKTSTNSDTMVLEVTLLDVNDNNPVFTNNAVYMIDIRKNTGAGHTVVTVHADDKDSEGNGNVTYSLESNTTIFKLDINTGMIQLIKDLSNSSEHSYTLDVKAVDNPTDKATIRSSWAKVVINIIDVNIHAPVMTVQQNVQNITENGDVGTVIADIRCTDLDWTDRLNVSIRMPPIYKNHLHLSDYFIFGESAHRLTLIQPLDMESSQTGLLMASFNCTDGRTSATEHISIPILDQNDNAPAFEEWSYNARVSINETTLTGTVVFNISASDGDAKPPNNEVKYAIKRGNLNDTFVLNETSGQLTIGKSINASLMERFDLEIVAYDGGDPELTNTTVIQVQILDENNNPPFFLYEPYEATVLENTHNAIIKVYAMDPDRYNNLTYAVEDGNSQQCNITFQSNTLYANNIDAEATTNGTLQCCINVSDGTNSVNTTVTIHVQDVNDNAPGFTKKLPTEFDITDTTPEGSDVTTFTATDSDISTRGEAILYLLEEDSSFFQLNHTTGQLTVQRSLEDVSGTTTNITVIAQDAGSPPRKNSIKFSIKVSNTNSHKPMFEDSSLRFNFNENQANFSMKIHATDSDGDSVSYTIVSGNDENIFCLDNLTGVLTTTNSSYTFNYESRSKYELIVEAKDNGTFPRSASATVVISIKDIGEAPTILYGPFEGNVTENTYAAILQLQVTDPDRNTDLHYTVGDIGTAKRNLTFENNTLYANHIDAEATTNGTYECYIIVSDGTNSVNTTVTIHIQDVNDNPPKFTTSQTELNISDTTREGSYVTTFNAEDRDISTRGEPILYLLEEESGFFKLNHKTGQLTVQRSLEKIYGTTKNITVIAQDAGSPPLQSRTNILLHVRRKNAHAPIFENVTFSFDFNENIPNFSKKINATDGDGDEVSYTIVSGNDENIFSLDKTTGVLTTTITSYTFDYETRSNYTLIVEAKDNGTFTRSASATVVIFVKDINEAPAILYGPFERNVTENTYANILQLYVTDPDRNPNHSYTVGDIGTSKCNLTFENNTLYANHIDAEATPNGTLECYIIVSDGTNSVNTTITIYIQDVNDNPPNFTTSQTELNITDIIANGSEVTTFHATDRDISTRGEPILYLLEEESGFFKLNYKTGQLTVQRSLEKIYGTTKNITVIGQDAGSPPLQSRTNILLHVRRENSHAPIFKNVTFSFGFNENIPNFSKRINASDGDGDEVSYTIVSGNDENIFSLDKTTGVLTTTITSYTFDYETRSNYTLIVEAKDNGTFTRSASATVVIFIKDINEAPAILYGPFERNVTENTYANILQLHVTDPDRNPYLNYTVGDIGTSKCNLTFENNTLYANHIDAEATPNGTLECYIIVSDGTNSVNTTITIYIQDVNDNPPNLTTSQTELNITDTIADGSEVTTFHATDRDISTRGEPILYLLEEESGFFKLNYKTGQLTVQRSLEKIYGTTKNITVIGQDAGSPPLQSRTNILLHVRRENAHAPIFKNVTFSFDFNENIPNFSKKINATDGDGDEVSYTIVSGNDENIFSLDKTTGVLTTTITSYTFDYETCSNYTLIVEATDNGTFTRSASATVVIFVKDINEAPAILYGPFERNVTENTYANILQLHVTDPDRNPNLNYTVGDIGTSKCNLTFENNTLYANHIDAEATPNGTLECYIIVSDGTSFVNTTVTIYIQDVNDNPPNFTTSQTELNITDTIPDGSEVTTFNAEDRDISTRGEPILYLLEEESGFFKLNHKTGQLIVQRSLEKIYGTTKNITVIAQDAGSPPLQSRTNILLHVRRENAHAPIFKNVTFSFDFNENIPNFSKKINATDGDGDEVSYTIVSGNDENIFSLDKTTGVLTTTITSYTFDYETRSNYTLIVEAKDNGTFTRSASATVVIFVKDINEAPAILYGPFERNVTENTYANILQLYVTDPDRNPNLNYTVGDIGTSKCNLTFENNTLYANHIDAEATTNGTLECYIIVSDGTNSVNTTITIYIQDVNDNPPNFTTSQTELNITDTIADGSEVTTFHATDRDISTRGEPILYLLEEESGFFKLNYKTGQLTVQRSLEKKYITTKNITVIGQDAGSPPLQSRTNILLHVRRENAHAPIFKNVTFSFDFNENIPNFSKKINATDGDGDDVSYTIVSGNDENIFSLDKTTGVLTTTITSYTFDYETRSNYTLIVEAKDNGTFTRSASATVVIFIKDMNEAPAILYGPFERNVTENTYANILQLYVTDPDRNPNLNYTVGDIGTSKCNLTFENNTLYANHIDAEATPNGTLECYIIVSDGTNSVNTTVTIYIQDVNDNPPNLTTSQTELNITDTIADGSEVTTFNATDRDISTRGEPILYLLEEESGFFKLNHTTGQLTVQRSLEKIYGTTKNITVIAQDAGSPPLQSRTNILLHVRRENAHAPLFKNVTFSFDFNENIPNFSKRINATDGDGDEVSYTIVSGNDENIFSLDKTTGVLTTTITSYTFDYETCSNYTLIVEATDNGTFTRSASATVVIFVKDINEAPAILYGPFETNVTENTYAKILQLHVTDPDRNPYLNYTVGDIGTSTCNLTFENNTLYANHIDAEATTNGTLECYIIVSDGTNSVNTTITIYIQDVNDNPPDFTTSQTKFDITDTIPDGSEVTTFIATDRDISTRGEPILYLLEEESGFFKLNHTTGQLTVQRSLEKIYGTTKNIIVIAQDAGSPPLQSRTNILLHVRRKNAHAPIFENVTFSFDFNENIPNFSKKINAIDGDRDEVSYTIVSGNDENIFSLDKTTGVLTTTITSYTFDYETRSNYTLIVEATDNGTFTRSASATVVIFVKDINEAPAILYGPFERNVTENTYADILELHVTDPDRNPDLNYTVGDIGTTKCNLTFENNTLYANHIDAEATTNGTFECYIIVSDGTNFVNTTVTIHVQDVNDNPPEFTTSQTEFNISDTKPEGSEVTTVNAMDRDISTEGQDILYLLKEDSSFFNLNHTTGQLIVQRSLEDISGTTKNLIVIAQDAGSPPRQSSIEFSVQVIIENSHAPMFEDNPIRFNFSENHQHFSENIKATDGDGDEVSYTILSGNDENIFSLYNTTGVLNTTKSSYMFDYETRSKYTLIVEAKDNGTFSRSASATVVISITDINEPPAILYGPFERYITENTDTAVLQVHVTDPDRHDKLIYTVADIDTTKYNLTFENNALYANHIDAEATTNGTFECYIDVSDGVNSVNTTVTIHVQDVNDNPPVFTTSQTEFNISDTTPEGSNVTTVNAMDSDISTRREAILYLLEEDSSFFKLNHKTGQLIVQRSLEDISGTTTNITVIAQDAGSPPRQSSIEFSIHVSKENSHEPVFKYPICFNFSENQQNFSKNIKATDSDGDEVSYSILSGNDENIFSLDNMTGMLTTTNVSYTFDFETRSKYTLIVEAKDNATFSQSASATVTISIIDINEPPTFPSFKPIYRKINTTVDNIITTITVADPDTNPSFRHHRFSFGSSKCSEQPGNVTQDGLFSIDANGTIRVHTALSKNGTFEPTVMVTNVNITRCAKITVIVSNIEGIRKDYSIRENNGVPYTLGALDDAFNYTITSENQANFEIIYNGSSSSLITRTRFDYEAMAGTPDHSVHCQIDGINKNTQTLGRRIQVTLTVNNTNDNWPVFNSTSFKISMYESVSPGDSIGLVTATDLDGDLTVLTYFANETDQVEMQENGTLLLAKKWDFDTSTNHQHILNVVCNDTEHVSNTSVVITLLDVNDNQPKFLLEVYEFNVTEAAPVGAIIHDMWITGSDVDTMDAGRLTYHIIPGEDGHYFTLDEHTGNFTLAEGLDFETCQHLEFKVMVEDTAFHNKTATVKVNVIDYNDNAPRFDQSVYNFTVQEGSTYMGDNFIVNATDRDSGINSQVNLRLLEPHIAAFNLSQDIDGHVGHLHIVSGLDRESPEVPHVNGTAIYTVTVIATDNGNPPLTSSALVHIYVEDINDCPPKFSQSNYNLSVQEGVAIGQQVTSFTTTDCDYNPAFTQTNFTLIGQGHESFQISTIDGNVAVVTVAKELDRNTQRTYNLTITVTDGENQASKNLTIVVLDTNDHPPRFNHTAYTFSIMEEQPHGVDVGVVSATDEDVGANGNVTYTITSGNQGNMFEITTNATAEVGIIKTTLKLDRENQTEYVLIITAEDGAIKGRRQGTCTVTVSLLDINDNSPVFNTNQGYKATVIENSPNATLVNVIPRIHAEDIDYGLNGTSGIRYSLLGDTEPHHFQINATTGEITVEGSIDREHTAVFNLTVVAQDAKGEKGFNEERTHLIIDVNDVNDCAPKFVNSTYVFSVVENSNSSTSVGRVSVTDDDVSGAKNVRFRIIHGDDEKFYIDTVNASGIIRVSGNIDRETKDVYTLTVTANDGINEGNTTVTINVLDTNDNAPVFDPPRISVMVMENSTPPTSICNVTAVDADQANNSLVEYSMHALANFSISSTGELSTLSPLDREQQDRYEITVFAKDLGHPRRTSSMQIVVRVGDVNDNSPEFFDENGGLITEKTANIVEKSPVNSVVSLIVARDRDAGENGTVMLSIANSSISDYFKIDQIDNVTAVVKVAKSVNINTLIFSGILSRNFTENVTLPLNITAQDNGPKNTSVTVMSILTLLVIVEAINDATPVFLHADEPLYVSENANIGTFIGNCKAVVANTTLVHLKYSLLDNNTKHEFSIDPENCTLKTKTTLDRERLDMYNFPVMVTDGRTPERTAFTVIQVRVLDENDNHPVFYRPSVSLEILENTNYTESINVSALDVDIGNNSLITYTLLDTFDGTFDVNAITGMLTLNQQLDHELQQQFNITVIARDNGVKPLNATCSVFVTVLDANDNTPQFYNINHTVHVKENFVGKILTAYANDSDSGMNGKVVYSLNSSLNGVFFIDPLEGAVSLNKPFDYETMKSHAVPIQITATDEGTPPNANTIDVTIEVEDVDDFIPTFNRDIYELNISRSAKIGDVVIDLNATDAMVNYELQGSDTDYFSIYKESVIRVSAPLDVQRRRYLLTVKATQKGHETNSATCKVIITVVDHLLTFPHKEYNVSLAENVVGSSVLVDLNTTDEINGRRVSYTIVRTEPEVIDVFRIDEDGRISCIKELNRENRSMYILYITAEPYNGRHRRDADVLDDSTSLVKIVVHVMDENDNPPVFPVTQKRQFGVPRDARSGYLVTSLRAMDIDLPTLNEEQINYNLTEGALTMFEIQRDSGDVFVRRALTSTKDNEFNLTVIAFDPKDNSKNDTITIKIRVIENGDRLLLVTPIPVEDFRRRQDELISNMSSVLGIDIQAEKVEAHRERRNDVISVNLDSSDLYFHGINKTTGMPVPNADIMARINSQSNQLQALFGRFNVTGVTVTRTHDSSTMGVPEIALLSVALLIFLGGVVAILFACSTLKNLEQAKERKPRDVRMSDLDDFELGTIRSKLSSSRDIAAATAINPAFAETEFNTSDNMSISDKPPTEQESQEIRLEFGAEPIDRNLPEAEVRGNLVHIPSQSAVDSGVGNTSLGSHDVLHSDTPETDSNRSDQNAPNELVLDTGPVMTSSPRIVRFKIGEPGDKNRSTTSSSEEGDSGHGEASGTGADTPRRNAGLLRLSSNVGETETDDGIETDDNDVDVDVDIGPVKDQSNKAGSEGLGGEIEINTEDNEVTSF